MESAMWRRQSSGALRAHARKRKSGRSLSGARYRGTDSLCERRVDRFAALERFTAGHLDLESTHGALRDRWERDVLSSVESAAR